MGSVPALDGPAAPPSSSFRATSRAPAALAVLALAASDARAAEWRTLTDRTVNFCCYSYMQLDRAFTGQGVGAPQIYGLRVVTNARRGSMVRVDRGIGYWYRWEAGGAYWGGDERFAWHHRSLGFYRPYYRRIVNPTDVSTAECHVHVHATSSRGGRLRVRLQKLV